VPAIIVIAAGRPRQVDRVMASSKSVQRQHLHKRQWQGGNPAGALQLPRYTNVNRTWAQQQQQQQQQ